MPQLRRVEKLLVVPDPGPIKGKRPVFSTVHPSLLYVDETYQRHLTKRSLTLINKLIKRWDWSSFSPPTVVRTDTGLHVIDGQHTAIAAISHPEIEDIPIMLVEAPEMEDRATAFVQKNLNRVVVTGFQLHVAALAAGDEGAQTVVQVCERAKVRLRSSFGAGAPKPGDTLALSAIRGVVNRRGALGARKVLDVLVEALLAPIPSDLIKAVDLLLHAPEYQKLNLDPRDLATVLRGKAVQIEGDARVYRSRNPGIPIYRAAALIILKRLKNGFER